VAEKNGYASIRLDIMARQGGFEEDHAKAAFGSKVAVITDCIEVFIEKPSNLLARAATWSNYPSRCCDFCI